MQIVDAQIHLWQGPGAPPHHRLGRETYSYDEALRDMDAAGVDAAINCPPIWDDSANRYAIEAALAHPDRFATLDWLDLTHPDVRHLLDESLARPGVIGLRFLTASPKAPADPMSTLSRINWPSDGRLDWLWDELAARAVPVTLYGSALLPRVRWIAERHPTLRVTIDHFGTIGNSAPDGALSQIPDLLDLSSLSNIAVKLTAAPSYAVGGYPYISVHPAVRELYDHYGPHRLFWGTDITRLNASWRECVAMFTEHMPWLSRSDLTLIMGHAICDWHGWRRGGD
jgi:predicted TIM-barrel fold metal-dependent hydrolase